MKTNISKYNIDAVAADLWLVQVILIVTVISHHDRPSRASWCVLHQCVIIPAVVVWAWLMYSDGDATVSVSYIQNVPASSNSSSCFVQETAFNIWQYYYAPLVKIISWQNLQY